MDRKGVNWTKTVVVSAVSVVLALKSRRHRHTLAFCDRRAMPWWLSLAPGRGTFCRYYYYYFFYFLAHQHKACRQLKIKQEMTAVGD